MLIQIKISYQQANNGDVTSILFGKAFVETLQKNSQKEFINQGLDKLNIGYMQLFLLMSMRKKILQLLVAEYRRNNCIFCQFLTME